MEGAFILKLGEKGIRESEHRPLCSIRNWKINAQTLNGGGFLKFVSPDFKPGYTFDLQNKLRRHRVGFNPKAMSFLEIEHSETKVGGGIIPDNLLHDIHTRNILFLSFRNLKVTIREAEGKVSELRIRLKVIAYSGETCSSFKL